MKRSALLRFALLVFIAAILFNGSNALADIRFSLYGLVGKSNALQVGGPGASGTLAPGGGLGLEFPLGSWTGIEIDALYLQRKNLGTFTYIEVPAIFRLWLGRSLSLGAGLYFADGLGSNFATNGIVSSDLGAVGALGVGVPVAGVPLFVEGRYQYGIWDASTITGVTTTFNSIQVLLGLRF